MQVQRRPLRVRELIFLTGYVSIISYSLLLGRYRERAEVHPAWRDGYVLIGASELQGFDQSTYPAIEWVPEKGIVMRSFEGAKVFSAGTLEKIGYPRESLEESVYYLVPRAWAYENLRGR